MIARPIWVLYSLMACLCLLASCSRSSQLEPAENSATKVSAKPTPEPSVAVDRGAPGTSTTGIEGTFGEVDRTGEMTTEIIKEAVKCVQKKADYYNFVILFNTSKSTNRTDPMDVSRASALRFSEKIGTIAAAGSKPEFRVSTLAFNKAVTLGANGWIKLGDPMAISRLNLDITNLTADVKIGERFDLAFSAGDSLLAQQSASGSNSRQRNYFIVLADGDPSGAVNTETELQNALNPIVNSKGAAVISIAAGSNLSESGKRKMQAMALPSVGKVAAEHIGKYYEGTSEQSAQQAWEDLFKLITVCDPVTP